MFFQCKKHGILKKEEIVVINTGQIRKNGTPCFSKCCGICRHEKQKTWKRKNKHLFKEYLKKSYKIQALELSDSYIKGLLIMRTSLKRKDITPELIQLKRAALIIKRKCKNEKK